MLPTSGSDIIGLVNVAWEVIKLDTKPQKKGEVRIADEVVSIIASFAAAEVDGVSSLPGGFAGGFAEMMGKKNLSKGVKVQIEDTVAVDVNINVSYGCNIPEAAHKVQENVQQAIENMTGLKVEQVNVHVQGIAFPKPEPVVQEETASE